MPHVIDLRELAKIPIPALPPMRAHDEIPIEESGEPFVAVQDYGDEDERLVDASVYSGRACSPYVGEYKLTGFYNLAWARVGLAERALRIQRALPLDHSLVAFDVLRVNEGQGSLWTLGRGSMDENPKFTGWSEETKEEYANQFVLPAWNSKKPGKLPNHPCGGVLDGAVCQLPPGITREDPGWQDMALRHGTLLDFGSPFDTADETSATRHFEELLEAGHKLTPKQQEALRSRRILAHLFSEVGGLTLRASEYWEGSWGTQFAVANDHKENNGVAIYDIADLTEQQKVHDTGFKLDKPIPSRFPIASTLLIS